jgi:hypothetical protein
LASSYFLLTFACLLHHNQTQKRDLLFQLLILVLEVVDFIQMLLDVFLSLLYRFSHARQFFLVLELEFTSDLLTGLGRS